MYKIVIFKTIIQNKRKHYKNTMFSLIMLDVFKNNERKINANKSNANYFIIFLSIVKQNDQGMYWLKIPGTI